jgi:hypothetical protein
VFNWFKKKPKVEFVCLFPEIKEIMPITPASKIKFDWIKPAIDDWKKTQEEMKNTPVKLTHFARCPGMHKIMREGWILRSWCDFTIKTDGDGKTFQWGSPVSQKSMDADHIWKWDYLSHHAESIFGQTDRRNTLDTVIKVQSPWIVYVPKGYYLLCMPCPYPDNHSFTAATGFIDGDEGPNFLNVQLYWHELDGITKIPAGTPLAQYMLVKKDKIDGDVRSVTDKDIKNLRLRSTILDNRFIVDYKPLKDTKWHE